MAIKELVMEISIHIEAVAAEVEVEVEPKEGNIHKNKEEIPIPIVVEKLQEDDPFVAVETEAGSVTNATRLGIMHLNVGINLLIEDNSLIMHML